MIADHQKTKGDSTLVRASSSNVMLFGNLGNLRQSVGNGGGGNTNSYNVLDYLPKPAREENPMPNGKYPNSVMGNVVKKQHEEQKPGAEQPGGPEVDHVDIAKAKGLQIHLNKCTEARRLRDWNTLIKETKAAISSGADSALLIYALQAEALIKLHRHQEADEVLKKGPNFQDDECTKYFGPIGNANLLMVRAQVDMAVGRFEEALAAAQRATRLDSNNKEANMVMKKARAVAAARSTGNQLFKAAKFYEASNAYGEGLEHDPYNSVLLCNRAACRSKLGQYEKAVEDCNGALNMRPNYSKARLRRADCYAKLEKWEASIQDYEILHKEAPDDEEVGKGLLEAKAQLKKHREPAATLRPVQPKAEELLMATIAEGI
ncbi:hypothetical protein GH714_018720 [Hevea brasiliensis]|uniref:Uncharacterized protein n=1 Tax=Hevea brasiliensis TaxID=3981 RepID=A0A6A6K769_HEVBR|nr:hypothetical protein GH714_018720 [Hevea brasiliensis]